MCVPKPELGNEEGGQFPARLACLHPAASPVMLSRSAAPSRPASHAAGALGAVTCPARMRRAGPVPRRVAALLGPPPRPRLLLLAVAVLVVAVAGASALEAARDLHGLLEYARAAVSS